MDIFSLHLFVVLIALGGRKRIEKWINNKNEEHTFLCRISLSLCYCVWMKCSLFHSLFIYFICGDARARNFPSSLFPNKNVPSLLLFIYLFYSLSGLHGHKRKCALYACKPNGIILCVFSASTSTSESNENWILCEGKKNFSFTINSLLWYLPCLFLHFTRIQYRCQQTIDGRHFSLVRDSLRLHLWWFIFPSHFLSFHVVTLWVRSKSGKLWESSPQNLFSSIFIHLRVRGHLSEFVFFYTAFIFSAFFRWLVFDE